MLVAWLWNLCFFFFKQKTAYEMRISDWSSDVCSSDLTRDRPCMENYGKPDRSCRIQGDAIIARAMDINAGPAEQRRSGDWGRCARAAQKSEARLKIGSGYNRDDHQAFLTNETSYKACPTPPNTGVASTRKRQAHDNP